jgi:hypothetical protein
MKRYPGMPELLGVDGCVRNHCSKVNPLPFEVVRKVVEDELLGGLPLEEARLGLGQ